MVAQEMVVQVAEEVTHLEQEVQVFKQHHHKYQQLVEQMVLEIMVVTQFTLMHIHTLQVVVEVQQQLEETYQHLMDQVVVAQVKISHQSMEQQLVLQDYSQVVAVEAVTTQ